ncbi:hypothetical protein Tco_1287930 [Tanacetum coccineum]
MAQPRGVSHGGQPPKTTAIVAARPIETTTAAPYGVGLMVVIPPFAPQIHESAGGLPKTKLVSHSCSLARSTSAMEVSILIAFVLPGREHEFNESFKLGRPPALS